MATTYMALSLPTVSSTIGPTWATMINTALTTIDSHTHVSGQGQQIPTAAINVNADFPVNSFNLTLARSLRFVSQSSPLALTTDANCLSVSGGNLYYNNGSAQSVQITSGAALSASSLGGISGLSAPASAAFSSSTGTFTWQSNTNKAAIMDCGPVLIRDTATSALSITLQSPVGLAANYVLTLPSALPSTTLPLTVTSTGTVAASNTLTLTGQSGSQALQLNGASGSPSRGALAIAGQTTPSSTFPGDIWYDSTVSPNRFGAIVNGTKSTTITAPTPNANWSATNNLGYWIDFHGVVHFRGSAAATGAATNPAFTLPAGFRPLNTRGFAGILNGSGSNIGTAITVQSNGNVNIVNMSTGAGVPLGADLYLDCVFFLAEQ